MPPKRKRTEEEPEKVAKTKVETGFDSDAKTTDGRQWNLKVVSWNVSGLRAWLKKDGMSIFNDEKPDIICLQETKCSDLKLPDEVKKIPGYEGFFVAGEKEGYAGMALFSKTQPIKVNFGIGDTDHDKEGRCITAEFEKFFVVNVYVPNSGRKLVTLEKRMDWDPKLRRYLKELDEKKPVIFCGDLNVAHNEIDLANPKSNKRNAGFTQEERDGFSDLLKEGFVDSFRHLYPDAKGKYTFWTYMGNCRAKNVGWRLDYFVLSSRSVSNLCDSLIRSSVLGSDHCPITLFMHF